VALAHTPKCRRLTTIRSRSRPASNNNEWIFNKILPSHFFLRTLRPMRNIHQQTFPLVLSFSF
jgi:hypothetical protein